MMGEQLQFEFDWGVEPWDGFTPRSLTRGWRLWKSLRSLDEAARHTGFSSGETPDGDPAQMTLFLGSGNPPREKLQWLIE